MDFSAERKNLPEPPQHALMDQLVIANGELPVGDQHLSGRAARVGQTPFHAYDSSLLRTRVGEVHTALLLSIELHHAMEANPTPAVVALLAGLVEGIGVALAGELKVALDCGADPAEISFAGLCKHDPELRQAVASGVLVNVESMRELPVLAGASQALGLPADVAVRLNPDFELMSSGMKMGGGLKQFDVDVKVVPGMLDVVVREGSAFEGFQLLPACRTCGRSRSAKRSRSAACWRCACPSKRDPQ